MLTEIMKAVMDLITDWLNVNTAEGYRYSARLDLFSLNLYLLDAVR